MRALPEPITAAAIIEACNVDHKKASNFLNQNTARGYLTRTGFGQYTRTRKYPAAASAQSGRLLEEIHGEIAQGKKGE